MELEGIDISGWQSVFDWNRAVNAGIAFAIAKATEGHGFVDPQWHTNQNALLSPGPIVGGSYHFFRGDPAEANDYLAAHDARVFSPLMPWIFSCDAEAEGTDAAVNDFCARVRSHVGYNPWLYSYGAWIDGRPGLDRSLPLWIAAPSSPKGQPPAKGWAAVTAHQYGTSGLGGDADVFLGDMPTLLKLAGVGSVILPPDRTQTEDDMPPFFAQGNRNDIDPHGPGALYIVTGWPNGTKKWLPDNGAVGAYVKVLADLKLPTDIKIVDQYVLDDQEDLSGHYERFDPNALKAMIDAINAKLDKLTPAPAPAPTPPATPAPA